MIKKLKISKKRKANTDIAASESKIVKLDTSVTEDKSKINIKNNNATKNKKNKQTDKPLPKNKVQKTEIQKKPEHPKPALNGKPADNNTLNQQKKKNKRRKKKPQVAKNEDSSDDEATVTPKPQIAKNKTQPKTENEADGSDDEGDTSKSEATPKKKKNRRKKKKTPVNDVVKNGTQAASKTTKKSSATNDSDDDSDVEMPSIVIDTKAESDSDSDEQDSSNENSTEKGSVEEKYPILKDEKLIKSFLDVPISNNQKGRIRHALVQKYKDVPKDQKPDIINSRIQAMLDGTELNVSQLRRIRILYNMLKEALKNIGKDAPSINLNREKPKIGINGKIKGPKRYVVFVGNLPLGTQKERLMHHFMDISDHIKDIRIPVPGEGKKRGFAYIELDNEASYELALSKNNTMLDNRRIKVQYSVQKESKISKTDAKGKSAKLAALQKEGKLIGSVPLAKKRSQRRKKMKTMRAAAETDA